MKKNSIVFLILFFIFVTLVCVILLLFQNNRISEILEYSEIMKEGDRVSEFEMVCLNGCNIDTKNKIIIFIFFNTICKSCKDNVPDFQKLYNRYNKKGIDVIGISSDSIERTNEFLNTYKLNFPVVSDPKKRIINKFRVKYFPLVVLKNANSRILFYQKYGKSFSSVIAEIDNLILKKSLE